MSTLICNKCTAHFEAEFTPLCPSCLALEWSALPNFITSKHHPDTLAIAWDSYRSVLTPRFVSERKAFIAYATQHGSWLYDTHYHHYVHFTPEPLGQVAGLGIRAGETTPDHALDSMMVAEATSEPHVFAVKRAVVDAQIKAGEFLPLSRCSHAQCNNMRAPELAFCARHGDLARAAPRRARPGEP